MNTDSNELLVVLDFDKTAVKSDSIVTLALKYFASWQRIRFIFLSVVHKFGWLSHSDFKRKVIPDIEEFLFLKRETKAVSVDYWTALKAQRSDLLEICQQSDATILVVSATPFFLVEFLLSDILTDKFAVAGRGAEDFYADGKVDAVRAYLASASRGFNLIIGFGDSYSDLELRHVCDFFYKVERDTLTGMYGGN